MDNRLLTAIRAQEASFTRHEARIATHLGARPEAIAVESGAVHVAGFQSMRYRADRLCQRRRYVRNNVVPLDTVNGVFGNMLTDDVRARR